MLKYKLIQVGELQSNCYILYNDESFNAVIIDPGDDADLILSNIDILGVKPEYVILTHAHFDHIGATDSICNKYDIGVLMNNGDAELLKNSNYNLSKRFCINPVTVECTNIRYVSDEYMQLIGEKFEFISTPGHSIGSMCIKVSNYIFTGDTLFYLSIGNEFEPFGSFKKEIESIKNKLFTLNGDFICLTGHGKSTTLDFERKYNSYIR